MMKKLVAICLILMLCVASASAAEWDEGYSPAKPYHDLPELDLEKTIGYMMTYPNSSMSVYGGRTLFIYMPREDVVAGSGKLHVRTEDQGEEWSVAFNDTEYVTQRPMLEQEMYNLHWGSGVCFEITLPTSLRLGTTYYIDLDTRCIEAGEKITNENKKGDTQGGWKFTTADYGVSEMSYRRQKADGSYETVVHPMVGDEIRFDLVMNDKLVLAAIAGESEPESVHFEVENFTESCEVVGTVVGENPMWIVLFLNENTPDNNIEAWVEF